MSNVKPEDVKMSKVQPEEVKTNLFAESLKTHFPGCYEFSHFFRATSQFIRHKGFSRDNTLTLVGKCRDEVAQPAGEILEFIWGNTFDLTSLAGMVLCGKTGIRAAISHAPVRDNTERYLFFCGPHIAIHKNGSLGPMHRHGRQIDSHACGSLLGILSEIQAGNLESAEDPDDIEQVHTKRQLLKHIKPDQKVDLVDLTKIAHNCIYENLTRVVHATLKDSTKTIQHIFVSYIIIHGPFGTNYIWLGNCAGFGVDKKERCDLKADLTNHLNESKPISL